MVPRRFAAEQTCAARRLRRRARGFVVLLVLAVVYATMSPTSALQQPRHSSVLRASARADAGSLAPGPLVAPGGPFLDDRYGRVVLLHGVSAVYKLPPYELYPSAQSPWDFTDADAAEIARLGFDVVRLGIVWAGLEPGTLGPNSPQICSPGSPRPTDQYDAAVAHEYLARLKQTVDLLGSYGIYVILDMHQDLYSAVFGGEGAPAWAVCTNGEPIVRAPGRWSNTYATAALNTAFEHFWNNDVRGDLQGEYDRMWALVAAEFRNDHWVIGYDPINEPFSTSLFDAGHHLLDAQIECFYTGRAAAGTPSDTHLVVTCPLHDPLVGLIPSIERVDPYHLIFYEPDIYTKEGTPNFIGAMDFPNLVLNFHSYCPQRDPVSGDPTDVLACAAVIARSLAEREAERLGLGTPSQRAGPALFMSEFGATNDPALLDSVTSFANQDLVGWCYWSWKFYDDPTGSTDEALVSATDQPGAAVNALEQPYPQAIAGTPTSISYDAAGDTLDVRFVPNHHVAAPTLVFVPRSLYPNGYCASVTNVTVQSPEESSELLVYNDPGARSATIKVLPGACPAIARLPSATSATAN